MKRQLLSVLAFATIASVAGAQQTTPARTDTHGDSVSAMHRNAHAGAKHKGSKKSTNGHHRTTSSSGGEVDRGGAGYSLHATSRDWVRADDTQGDDLYRREQMMDAKCGKSRERCGRP